LLWVCACHSSSPAPLTAEPSAICYNLEFGKWAAGDSTIPFAVAPVGLHTPLPKVVALTRTLVKSRSPKPSYVATRRPQDTDQLSGFWSTIGRDSVFVVFPLTDGSALRMRLLGLEQRPRGEAWVSPKQPAVPRGSVRIDDYDLPGGTPSADVAATLTQCPDSLGVVRAGA